MTRYIDFWLPVDSPVRDNCLQRINKAMNCKFKTKWQKVGSSGQTGFLIEGDKKRATSYIDFYDRIVQEFQ